MNFYFRFIDAAGLEFKITILLDEDDKFSHSFGTREADMDETFADIFRHDYSYFSIVKEHVKFAPCRCMNISAFKEDGIVKAYYLALFGVFLFQVFPNTKETPIILNLVPRENFGQLERLIIDTEKVPKKSLKELEIDILFSFGTKESGTEPKENIQRFPFQNWLSQVNALYPNSNIFFKDESILVGPIDLENSNDFELATESGESVKSKTYMNLKLEAISKMEEEKEKEEIEENKAKLQRFVEASFNHDLTVIGQRVLARLKSDLLKLFETWTSSQDSNILVPIVSICQSSGSGKSKIAIELLKRNPGFYFVFRNEGQTGYPFNNKLSEDLRILTNNFRDTPSNQERKSYSKSSIGKILHFFVKIITSYFRVLIKFAIDLKKDDIRDTQEVINTSVSKFAEIFEKYNNQAQEWFNLVDDQVLLELYEETAISENIKLDKNLSLRDAIKVQTVSMHLDIILNYPIKCLNLEDRTDPNIVEICLALAKMLSKFPFVFVLDEADLLTQSARLKRTTTEFEDLRRAISYLSPKSKIIFVTLGTKSTVVDLNPVIRDSSSRFTVRKVIPLPIILTSNCSIFSRQFPITKLNPSYDLLRNPILFKFIATLGHGLWGSYPFDEVVRIAATKLVNGSGDSLSYFLPIWMILTGLSSNPLNVEVSSLVANHMGTLLDLPDNMRSMVVTYPSEPILALAAHHLIDSLVKQNHPYSGSYELFKTLKNKTEAVIVDRGEMSEAFAAMAILRTIWKTKQAPEMMNCDETSYTSCLEAIRKEDPSGTFDQLWNLKSFLLESSDFESKLCCVFPDYKICTVEDFLKKWTHDPNFDLTVHGLSSDVSQGIINAKQFIRLIRDKKGFKGHSMKVDPTALPSADSRVFDSSRNVIDYGLLKIGLLRQCGFFLPSGHYGIDLIIPVCMKNNGFTFISIQVKVAGANLTDDIEKMQARFNFVKCPECEKFKERPNCTKCVPTDEIKKIYENQISLLISLTDGDKDENTSEFRSSFSTCLPNLSKRAKLSGQELKGMEANKIKDDEDLMNDLEILRNVFVNYADTAEPFKGLINKNPDFMNPVSTDNIVLANNILLSKKIWADAACETMKSKKVISSLQTDDIPRDNMIHRQFCICTRGWKHIRPFFVSEHDKSGNDPLMFAKEILESQGLFKNRGEFMDDRLLKTVLYDISPTYYEYSDELKVMHFDDSNMELLEKDLGTLNL